MVVSSRSSVRSTLFLVVTFFSMAGVWLLLQAEFLALILVLVYVGAVMTLFLFVVMMINSDVMVSFRQGFIRHLPLGILIVLLVLGLTIMVISPERLGLATYPEPLAKPADYNNLTDLGMVLYTNYFFPFILSGVLLLAAIVAAISLAHRVVTHYKKQNVNRQIAARAQDRVRLVKMPAESMEVKSP